MVATQEVSKKRRCRYSEASGEGEDIYTVKSKWEVRSQWDVRI